jgi:hypothetical protein
VAGFVLGGLIVLNGDGQIAERRHGIVEGVGEELSARGNVDILVAVEGERLVCGGIDGRGRGGSRDGDVNGGEVEWFGSEGVGDVNADGGAADRQVNDLTECRVLEVVRGAGVRGVVVRRPRIRSIVGEVVPEDLQRIERRTRVS